MCFTGRRTVKTCGGTAQNVGGKTENGGRSSTESKTGAGDHSQQEKRAPSTQLRTWRRQAIAGNVHVQG